MGGGDTDELMSVNATRARIITLLFAMVMMPSTERGEAEEFDPAAYVKVNAATFDSLTSTVIFVRFGQLAVPARPLSTRPLSTRPLASHYDTQSDAHRHVRL